MRYKLFFLLLAFCGISVVQAQTYRWKFGMDYFFDNTEYGKSSFLDSQSMNGLWFNPIGSVHWDSAHSINGGVNILKIPGMKKTIDKIDVALYYQYQTPKVLFRAGAFPRKEALPNYSNFFFKDSINNFVPLMQGVFWQIGHGRNFFNMWMDWTGYATPDTRENFYLGFSGKASKGILFADFQSYLFHYAGTNPGNPIYSVSEQLQAMASAGVEYESENSFKGLLSGGILTGFERDRRAEEKYTPTGFVARVDAEFWGIGTQNLFYAGNPRMRFFNKLGGDLYWGTQFLRGNSYLQSKWYIRLLESDWAKVRFNSNLHFTEGHMLFQQTLSVVASFDSFSRTDKRKKVNYPWMKVFNP